ECSHGRKPGVRLSEDAEPRKGRKTLRRVFRPYGAEFNTNTNPGLAPGATFLSRSAAMSGANASPIRRSHQDMSGANASPIGRSHQGMSGANASPIGRSHQGLIKVEHLSKSFGDLAVLTDVNAEIKRGEVVSIIGPSGAGKSTFLRCLNLLDRPTGGSIIIDGVDVLQRGTDVSKIRQKMNMVFQSFNLFAHLSVLDNLTLAPMKLRRLPRD